MPIKIIKKVVREAVNRVVANPEAPPPVAAQQTETPAQRPTRPAVPISEHVVRVCAYCRHAYVEPCDGKDDTCGNAVFVKAHGVAATVRA